jgi:hypothetical protein
MPVDPWLARVPVTPEAAARVKEFIADTLEDGLVRHEAILLRGRKAA